MNFSRSRRQIELGKTAGEGVIKKSTDSVGDEMPSRLGTKEGELLENGCGKITVGEIL